MTQVIQVTWDKYEHGWYLHPQLGGICQESDKKWYWYPAIGGDKQGPFDILREAKEAAERAPLYDPEA